MPSFNCSCCGKILYFSVADIDGALITGKRNFRQKHKCKWCKATLDLQGCTDINVDIDDVCLVCANCGDMVVEDNICSCSSGLCAGCCTEC